MTYEQLCRELLVERFAVPTPEYKNIPPLDRPPVDESPVDRAIRRYELDVAVADEEEREREDVT